MLQPRSYPEMIGKALVLEAEPFTTLADDDNPWVEGLFLVVCVGVAIGLADLVGGLLLTASLPPADATREALLQAWRQVVTGFGLAGAAPLEAGYDRAWNWIAGVNGFGGGWARLWFALLPLTSLLLQWIVYGVVAHVAALALGGTGKLSQTLGATALMAAPAVFSILTVIPFVSVSPWLTGAWALLIVYRAVAVAHELPWSRALIATLAAPAVGILLALAGGALAGILLALGGLG